MPEASVTEPNERLGWDPIDIVAQLKKKGRTATSIARDLGVSGQRVSQVINGDRGYSIERAIAETLCIPAEVIFADRYPPAFVPRKTGPKGSTEKAAHP